MDQGDCSVIKYEEHVVKSYVLPMLKVRLQSILFEYWIQRLVTISILFRSVVRCLIVVNISHALHNCYEFYERSTFVLCVCVHACVCERM